MGGISHGDKFGNLIGTCGRVAADKSDNVWHWHEACEWAMLKKKKIAEDKFGNLICEWAMLKKKIAEVWHGVFRTGTNSGTSYVSGPWKKKKLQKFGTGYFARGQIREPHM